MGLTFSKLFYKERLIFMVGLPGAGRTTILYKLKLGEVVTTTPTIDTNVETVEYKNSQLTLLDISPLHRHYLPNAGSIIFVVDSTDRGRFTEARRELKDILYEWKIADAPLLVFANKQDLPNAVSTAEITEQLGLQSLSQHPCFIQPTSAATGDGLYEGLEWLTDKVSKSSKAGPLPR